MAVGIPLAMAAYSAYSQHKANQQNAQEKAGMAGQLNASNQLAAQGQQAWHAGFPGAQSALSYYSTLLSGNRAAMQQATAGPQAQLTDMYRGAERGIAHAGVRGGVRDLGLAELGRDRANATAQLTTGQQGAAAQGLAGLSTTLMGQGSANQATSGNLAGQMQQEGFQQRQAVNQGNAETGAGIGQALFDVYRNGYKPNKAAGKSGIPGAGGMMKTQIPWGSPGSPGNIPIPSSGGL
jgi:hypothetical protein